MIAGLTSSSAPRVLAAGLLATLLLAALAFRMPRVLDAEYNFTSDEAVDALVVRHLMQGRGFTLFNWDATYYGIAEGVLTVPLVWLLGDTAATYKLGAVAGHLLLMTAVYFVARWLYGRRAGLLGAALLVVVSPTVVYWSTLAAGGYSLVVALGVFTILQLGRVRERPTAGRWLGLGLLAGFGFYVYRLFLVFIVTFALWLVVSAASRAFARRPRAAWPLTWRGCVAGAAGSLVGAAPVVARVLLGSGAGGKEPSYAMASWETLRSHAGLLIHDAGPILFGAPGRSSALPFWTAAAGWVFLGFLSASWAWAAWRTLRHSLPAASPLDAGAVLALLVPVNALLFVVGANTQDALSNRYLLPSLGPLAIYGGATLASWWRRAGVLRAAAVTAVLLPCVAILSGFRRDGTLDAAWRPRLHHEPLNEVVTALEREAIRAAYAPYWVAYKATFLARERVIVTPYAEWTRYAPYDDAAARASREAYVFAVDAPTFGPVVREQANAARERFEAKLAAAGRQAVRRDFGFYRVYTPETNARLLPPPRRIAPERLLTPRAEVRAVDPPAALPPGSVTRIAAAIRNDSESGWSADGLIQHAGSYRVSVCYRWLNADGSAAVVVEGERTPLPEDVPPGGTIDVLVAVRAPAEPGKYLLRVTLVQENVAWFDQATGSQSQWPVEVRPAGSR